MEKDEYLDFFRGGEVDRFDRLGLARGEGFGLLGE
jgi:hypothetical protein